MSLIDAKPSRRTIFGGFIRRPPAAPPPAPIPTPDQEQQIAAALRTIETEQHNLDAAADDLWNGIPGAASAKGQAEARLAEAKALLASLQAAKRGADARKIEQRHREQRAKDAAERQRLLDLLAQAGRGVATLTAITGTLKPEYLATSELLNRLQAELGRRRMNALPIFDLARAMESELTLLSPLLPGASPTLARSGIAIHSVQDAFASFANQIRAALNSTANGDLNA